MVKDNTELLPYTFFTFKALETVNNSKATYEKTAKDIKVKHTAQKDETMKTVTDGISKILDEKIKEVDKIYDPACQKLSVQAEAISNYLEKVEKSIYRTNEVMKNSKLQELMTAQKMIDDDIQMLQNEKPQNLTSFQVQVENPESCMKKLCFYTMFKDLAANCEYVHMFHYKMFYPGLDDGKDSWGMETSCILMVKDTVREPNEANYLTIRLKPRDFYEVILDKSEARINYRLKKLRVSNLIVLVE